MNLVAGQVKFVGGQVAFVFKLPTGRIEFSGLILTQNLPVQYNCKASLRYELSDVQ